MKKTIFVLAMGIIEVLLIAVGVSMDAFAVSICKGLAMKKATLKASMTCGLWFGGFQALMPIFGYFCGNVIANIVKSVAPIVGFVLLVLIGLNMIRESLTGDDEEITDHFSLKEVTLLAIATSIDAFAVGITIALVNDPILISAAIIGIVAFAFSIIGIHIGKRIGNYVGDKFEIVGGVILILIGIKILMGF